MPYGVYTIPEIATVGETEEQLHAPEVDFEIGRACVSRAIRADRSSATSRAS